MRNPLIVLTSLVTVAAVALGFLLTSNTGLRWIVDRALARSGLALEIEVVEGRLLGPVTLSGIAFQDPESGASVHMERVRLEWRARALLGGLLHVTRLHAAGIDYRQGASAGSPAAPEPRLEFPALPLAVQLDRFSIESAALTLGTGEPLRIRRASLRGALDGESILLDELAVDAERYAASSGRLRLETSAPWTLAARLDWSANPPGLASFSGSMQATGSLEKGLVPEIELREPFIASVKGRLAGGFSSPRWRLDGVVPKAVALNRLTPDWPAVTLQGRMEAHGDTTRARLQPDILLSFRDTRATLSGEVSVSLEELVVTQARLGRPGAADTVDFSGRVGLAGSLPFSLQGSWQSLHGPAAAPWASPAGEFRASGDATGLNVELSGMLAPPGDGEPAPLALRVKASGPRDSLTIAAEARLPYLAYAGMAATELAAEFDFHAPGAGSSTAHIKVSSLTFDGQRVSGLEARASGSVAEHQVSLSGRLEQAALAASADGAYADGGWRGTLREVSLDSNLPRLPGRWRLAAPAGLAWSGGETRAEEICLRRAAASICATAQAGGGQDWTLTGKVSALPLRWLAAADDQPVDIEGNLAARLSLGNRGDGIRGDGEIRVDQATVRWRGEDPVTTRYRGLRLDASLDPARLHMEGGGSMDGGGVIRAELTTGQPLAADGPLAGRLSADLPSLRIINAAAPQLGLNRGALKVELSVAGRRAAPRFEGQATIEGASMTIQPLGMVIRDLTLRVTSEDARRLELTARAMAGDGPLQADGFIEWPVAGGWRGELALRGEQARLVSLPRALIEGSPDLRVRVDESGGTVEGRIKVPRAELTPDAGRPSVTLSDDFVVLGDDPGPAAANPMDWHARVRIELGNDVRFKGYGLSARLTGSLELDAPPRQPARASGQVDIEDGRYELYGRGFDIKRGRVIYAGGPLDSPGIDLQVERRAGEVTVSLAVSGPLREPELTLSSTPAMSETDRMSYLLLGRPAAQASEAEAGLLLRAAASLVPGGPRGVPAYIQSTLKLDTLEVHSDSADSEGAALVLGKYLSPRLYLSYVAGLQTAVDVFRVRYDLARHWLLQAQSSAQGSGGDILFTW